MEEKTIILSEFNPMVIDALSKFVKGNVEITDNNLRADFIMKLLRPCGFREVGCGTNRIVVSTENKPGYVFKIALDKQGIIDNNLEMELSPKLFPYVTTTYDNIGIIAAAEHVQVMNRALFNAHWGTVRNILFTIAQKYILNDVGPKSFMNWGIRDDNNVVILDYAYLTRITPQMNFRCKAKDIGDPCKCGGLLKYNNDFTEFECVKCGAKFAIGDIAKTVDGEELGFNSIGVDKNDEPEEFDFINTGNDSRYQYDENGFNETM